MIQKLSDQNPQLLTAADLARVFVAGALLGAALMLVLLP